MSAENQQRIVGIGDTKTNCTALTGTPSEIIFARATDTGELGVYVGGSWYWFKSGHTLQDETTPLANRLNMNFTGAGVAATDDGANDATKITIQSWQILMADGITPPDPLTTDDETDWLYEG